MVAALLSLLAAAVPHLARVRGLSGVVQPIPPDVLAAVLKCAAVQLGAAVAARELAGEPAKRAARRALSGDAPAADDAGNQARELRAAHLAARTRQLRDAA